MKKRGRPKIKDKEIRVVISTPMTTDEAEKLTLLARNSGRSRSAQVAKILREHLEE